MTCDHAQVTASECESLSNELTESPRTNQEDTVRGLDLNLILDFESRGKGFSENSHLVRYGSGDAVQVGDWQCSVFSKCPVTIDNPKNCPVFTMGCSSIQALLALVTNGVNLPHYALTNPYRIVR